MTNDIVSSPHDKIKRKKRGAVVIPSGTLAIERVCDANQSVQDSGSGEVRVLAFHPKPDVPVLCVATAGRRVRLFNVSVSPFFYSQFTFLVLGWRPPLSVTHKPPSLVDLTHQRPLPFKGIACPSLLLVLFSSHTI